MFNYNDKQIEDAASDKEKVLLEELAERVKIVTVCVGGNADSLSDMKKNQKKLYESSIYIDKADPVITELKVPGYPYCFLVNSTGLVVWQGHPADRMLKDDIFALLNNEMLFETEDQEDDPEEPRKDPDDLEAEKKDKYNEKKKERLDVLGEAKKKAIHFQECMKEVKNEKGENFGYLNDLSNYCKEYKIGRAFCVLSSECTLDLWETRKDCHDLKMVLHKVVQGDRVNTDKFLRGMMMQGKKKEREQECDVYWKDKIHSEMFREKYDEESKDAKTVDAAGKEIVKSYGLKDLENEGRMPRCGGCLWCACQHVKENYIKTCSGSDKMNW